MTPDPAEYVVFPTDWPQYVRENLSRLAWEVSSAEGPEELSLHVTIFVGYRGRLWYLCPVNGLYSVPETPI
jgi:hypothetical protein